MGCDALRWQGRSRGFKPHAACLRSDPRLQAGVRPARETTLRARAREEEQRRQRSAARLNRVRSGRYKLDLALEAEKASIHTVLRGIGKRPGEICGLSEPFHHAQPHTMPMEESLFQNGVARQVAVREMYTASGGLG